MQIAGLCNFVEVSFVFDELCVVVSNCLVNVP